jgi:N-methylhydantoinase A
VVPPQASVLSALGMLLAPLARDFSQALLCTLDDATGERLQESLTALKERASGVLAADGIAAPDWEAGVDCRYAGQSYELTVPLALPVTSASIAALEEDFHAAHEQRYGARYAQPVEMVTARLRGAAPSALEGAAWLKQHEGAPHQAKPTGQTEVWFDRQGPRRVPTFERETLQAGAHIEGPALIFQPDTTTVIAPGWRGAIDGWGNVVLRYGA